MYLANHHQENENDFKIMETNTNYVNLFSKFEHRKTGEIVEIVANNCDDNGARNETDWVTYIDSKGEEHIKEHLHFYLDFRVVQEVPDYIKKVAESATNFNVKYPSSHNSRFYELAKELYLHKGCTIDESIEIAKTFVNKTKDVFENGQEENGTEAC